MQNYGCSGGDVRLWNGAKTISALKDLEIFYRNRAYIFLGYVNSLLLILCLFDCIRIRGHNIIIFFNPREECHYIQGSAHNNKLALHMCTRVRETGFFRPTHTRTITHTLVHTIVYIYINTLYTTHTTHLVGNITTLGHEVNWWLKNIYMYVTTFINEKVHS